MEAALDTFFRFKIGDLISLRTQLEAFRFEIEHNPQTASRQSIWLPDMVIERKVQQCHGGIQGFYLVRRATKDGMESLVTMTGDEACAFEDIKEAFRAARTVVINPSPWATVQEAIMDELAKAKQGKAP